MSPAWRPGLGRRHGHRSARFGTTGPPCHALVPAEPVFRVGENHATSTDLAEFLGTRETLAADLSSLRGLKNLGPALREWRSIWQGTVLPKVPPTIAAPTGGMAPLGYVIMQSTMRLDRPVRAYQRWLERIPHVFAASVLDQAALDIGQRYEIATLRNYQSLMPLAHDARKPMFDLRSADGALGSTQKLVNRCYHDFQALSRELLRRLAELPHPAEG